MNDHAMLNKIYEPMYSKAKTIYKELSQNYKVSLGWYNMHSKKVEEGYITQYYPIPIVSIEGVGDIGIDIDSTFFEVKVNREKALALSYKSLVDNYKIEIYGVKNYLIDFYNKDMDVEGIYARLNESDEAEICLNVVFSLDDSLDSMMLFLKALA